MLAKVKENIGKGNEKGQLQDEDAVLRMFKLVKEQQKRLGDLRARLKAVSFQGRLGTTHFGKLVTDQLKMKDNDLLSLLRVSGLSARKKKDATLPIEDIAKNLEDAVANSEELREQAVKEVAELFKERGISLTKAFSYFDDDKSGVIERADLVEGFKRMQVDVGQKLIESLFVILDRNCDNEISIKEFEAVFDKYLGTGGAVKTVTKDALKKEIAGLDDKDAAKIARQMTQE